MNAMRHRAAAAIKYHPGTCNLAHTRLEAPDETQWQYVNRDQTLVAGTAAAMLDPPEAIGYWR